MHAILQVRPDALFIQSESTEYFHAESPAAIGPAELYNARRFLSLDLNYGRRVDSEMYEYMLDNGMTRDEYHFFLNNNLKHHCIMGNDYYQTNEHYVSADGMTRSAGEIFGYAVITHQYYNRYRLPVMHTETNLCQGPRGDEAVHWLRKEWANVLRVRNNGVPLVGFTWYSLTDQVDWDTALRENNGNVNALGLFDLDRKIRPVGIAYKELVRDWMEVLPTQSVCLQVPIVMPHEFQRQVPPYTGWPFDEGCQRMAPPTAREAARMNARASRQRLRVGREGVGLAMREIAHLRLQPGRLDFAREIRQRRLEHVVVVEVDRDRVLRLDDLHQLDAVLAVHRHLEHAQDARAAQVQQGQVDAGEALRDVLQIVVDQRIAADVHAVARRAVFGPKSSTEPITVGSSDLHAVLAVAAGHGREAQARLRPSRPRPRPRWPGRCARVKPSFFSASAASLVVTMGVFLSRCFLHEAVEVVFVHVRQHHEVDRRQLVEIDGRIGQARRT